MKAIVRYILLTASRDFLFLGLILLNLAAFGLSVFMGTTALVEQSQMLMAYFAGASRVIVIGGLMVFICFHIRRGFDNREIEATLSKPISRIQFVGGCWLGYVALVGIAVLAPITILAFCTSPNWEGLLYWSVSLFLEASLMMAFALLASLIMRSAVTAVLSCISFYLVARLMGFFVAAMNSSTSLLNAGGWEAALMTGAMRIISLVLPRFDLFAKSDWLIYGVTKTSDIWLFEVQSLVYLPFLLGMAMVDFRRKEF